jgi:lipopolysaccharide transport system permease protein
MAHNLPSLNVSGEGHAILIEPSGHAGAYWRELWDCRELLILLAWRDVSIRYRQTVMGVVWAIVRPALTMIAFTVIFGRVAKLHSIGNVPYAIMVFAGVLPWFLFSNILSDASNSIVANANLITKVYFPRVIIPAAALLVALVDFALNLTLLLVAMAWLGLMPTWRILLLPAFVTIAAMAGFGLSLLIASLNIRRRDFRFLIPLLLQFGLYISPVGFSSTSVPERFRVFFALNPLVGAIDGVRWSVLGPASPIDPMPVALGAGLAALILWLGFSYFRKTEQTFADAI